MIDIHQHLEGKTAVYSEGSQYLEAAQVRAEQDAAPARFDLVQNQLSIMDLDIEVLELPGQHVYTIEQGSGEAMDMLENMPVIDAMAQYLLQVLP